MDWRTHEIHELTQDNGYLRRRVTELENRLEDAIVDAAMRAEAKRIAIAESARIRQHEAEERLANLETLCQLARQNYAQEHSMRVRAENTIARMVHCAEMQALASASGEAVLRFVRSFVHQNTEEPNDDAHNSRHNCRPGYQHARTRNGRGEPCDAEPDGDRVVARSNTEGRT